MKDYKAIQEDLEYLREIVDRLNQFKPKVNFLLRDKISEFENEMALSIQLVEDKLAADDFGYYIDPLFIKGVQRTDELMKEIIQMTQDMPNPSKN